MLSATKTYSCPPERCYKENVKQHSLLLLLLSHGWPVVCTPLLCHMRPRRLSRARSLERALWGIVHCENKPCWKNMYCCAPQIHEISHTADTGKGAADTLEWPWELWRLQNSPRSFAGPRIPGSPVGCIRPRDNPSFRVSL